VGSGAIGRGGVAPGRVRWDGVGLAGVGSGRVGLRVMELGWVGSGMVLSGEVGWSRVVSKREMRWSAQRE